MGLLLKCCGEKKFKIDSSMDHNRRRQKSTGLGPNIVKNEQRKDLKRFFFLNDQDI